VINLIAVPGQKEFAACKVGASQNYRVSSRAHHSQIRVALYAHLAARQVHLACGLHSDIELHSLRE